MGAKKWIEGATRNARGQFKAKAERAKLSTKAYALKQRHAKGRTGKQARLALTLMERAGRKLYGG